MPVMDIRKLRRAKGLTQVELAELADLPQPAISWYESGSKPFDNMTVGTAKKLAKALQVSLDELLAD
jgi:transcriptional regulator with XRE-family HTH domain